MDVNTSVTIASNRGGGYSLDGTAVESAEIKKPQNTDLAIKWGMAFNNATKLVCTDHDLKPARKADLIQELMPKMFEIARGLDAVLEQEQKNDDDLPF